MVSDPNFILGIKWTSLASKEDSHVHITIRSHTCLFTGSRLHDILQPPWLCAMSKSNNQAICVSPYQICAHQAFAWWNQQDKRASQHIATKTQELNLQWQLHAPTHVDNGSWNFHTHCWRFSTPSSDLSHMRCQDGLVVPWSTWAENLVIIRRHTHPHAPPGYLSRHHDRYTPSRIEKQMLVSSFHISMPRTPSATLATRNRMTLGALLPFLWLDSKTRNRHEPCIRRLWP